MWQTYTSVTSLDEALEILAVQREKARIVAGATDLILELERKVRKGVETLVDITRVPQQDQIALAEDGLIHLGCLVTHNACVGSKLIMERALPLAQACWEVGAPQIRNRATVAGNLITASPANDTITPLMALEAQVTLRSKGETRTVPLKDFYTGVRKNVLRPDELLTDISFAPLKANERGMFIKLALRRAQAISVINVAVVLEFADGVSEVAASPIVKARLALGAVAPVIIRVPEFESYLIGKRLDEATIVEAGRLAMQAARPIDDVRATAEYRRVMVGTIVARTLRAIANGEERGWLPAEPVMLWGKYRGAPETGLPKQLTHLEEGTQPIALRVNGREYTVAGANDKTLLRLLREDLNLIGTKEGCAEGECGACTVFMDGAAVMSCLVPAPRAHGAEIVTVEGLAGNERLHPLQQAFIEEGAVQCGYCTPGLLMAGAKLLEERAQPTEWDAQQAIMGNLCRCTGYYKILSAFAKAGHYRRTV